MFPILTRFIMLENENDKKRQEERRKKEDRKKIKRKRKYIDVRWREYIMRDDKRLGRRR